MSKLPELPQCRFSAFISYSHADDQAWNHWVTDFGNELERGLRARLRGLKVPGIHLSGDNGPVSGSLDEELQQRIAESFAMIIVVHDGYVQSDWCRNELRYFKSLFGDAGLRERLYIVAMSEPAVNRVTDDPGWRDLVPDAGQVWKGFFKDERERDTPLPVYLQPNRLGPEFLERFNTLREDFVGKLKPQASPVTLVRVAAAPPPAPAITPVAAKTGGVLVGIVSPALKAAASQVVDQLRELGLESRAVERGAEDSDFAEFDSADALVLPFDDSPLLMPFYAGGHLGLQRDSWLRKGKPEDRLLWLDLRPPGSGAALGSAAWVQSAGVPTRALAALLAELRPVAPPPPPAGRGVCIYIESNRNEPNHWETLGNQIRRTWDEVFDEIDPERRPPPLYLRTRGLPVDQIEKHPPLDDADGVVLLWGKKTPDALVAQINKVEGKQQGRDGAPGMVAYLMPPQPADDEPIPAWGWKVLRFNAPDEDNVGVVASDFGQLKRFLRQVAERSRRRELAGAGR